MRLTNTKCGLRYRKLNSKTRMESIMQPLLKYISCLVFTVRFRRLVVDRLLGDVGRTSILLLLAPQFRLAVCGRFTKWPFVQVSVPVTTLLTRPLQLPFFETNRTINLQTHDLKISKFITHFTETLINDSQKVFDYFFTSISL